MKHQSPTARTILALLAALLAAGALALPAAAADRYIAGVTDFPSYGPTVPPAAAGAGRADRLDWPEVALGVALGALAVGTLPALRRRLAVASA